jgi:RNA polymerase sigma-70 factor (ECF subfamily)
LRDANDVLAWREFDARYGALVVAYCRSRGLQFSDAEDVRQFVMLNLCRTLPGFEYQPARGRFRNYLGCVVRNAVARHMRRHTGSEQALPIDGLDAPADPEPDEGDGLWEQEWVRHHCRRAMMTLRQTHDPHSIEIFERLLAGDPIQHVADRFSTTAEAVRKTKQRLRDALREIVDRQIREEDTDA